MPTVQYLFFRTSLCIIRRENWQPEALMDVNISVLCGSDLVKTFSASR